MAEVCLGSVPSENADRDAIHVAVIAMKAAELLRPGQRVGIVGDRLAGSSANVIGIVDPYLDDVVPKGRMFWLALLPNTVTGMRHHWQHPAFSEPVVSAEQFAPVFTDSIAYLHRQAEERGLKYDELMRYVDDFVTTGRYVVQGGRFEGQGIYDDEFWVHYEKVTGKKVEEDDRGGVFSCSC